jgi:DNA primase
MQAATEIEEVVRRYLHKVKAGGSENIMAVCPFHLSRKTGGPEQHPSFAISTRTGLYFCHSCKEKGNLRQFLLAMGVSNTALHKQFGLLLEATSKNIEPPSDPTRFREATDAGPLPEGFLGLFESVPQEMLDIGFTEETLRRFDIGFDEVHQRITFPIRDYVGTLIGVSGRSVEKDAARRYKIYDVEYEHWGLPKRRINMADVLWNVDMVYPHVYFRTGAPLVLVEGFKAAMWLYQAGVHNVVALGGSYLKDGQQRIIEHLGCETYVMLDMNDAGKRGTDQIGKMLSRSLPTRVVTYRDESQPSDLAPYEILEALDNSTEYFHWLLQQYV